MKDENEVQEERRARQMGDGRQGRSGGEDGATKESAKPHSWDPNICLRDDGGRGLDAPGHEKKGNRRINVMNLRHAAVLPLACRRW